MDAREVLAGEHRIGDRRGRAGEEVDDAIGQPGLPQQLEDVPVAEGGRRRGLPDDRVAHQRRRRGQVAADRGEVEGRDRVDEPLERAVVEPVPHPGAALRLLPVDPLGEVDVEAEEVDQLAGAVDLGLECGLALAEHGGGVDPRAPRAGEQVGGLEEDGGPVLERPAGPVALRLDRGRDGAVDGPAVRLMHTRQNVAVPVGRDHVVQLAGTQLLAAGHHGDLGLLAPHHAERVLEGLPRRGAGGVGQDGLIAGSRDVRDAAHDDSRVE